jgi:hypothetical protein
MRKEYFKPVTEIIEAEYVEFIAHSLDEMDGKENNPNDDDNEGDIWNPHYNIWD